VLQFAASIVLITIALVSRSQMAFVSSMDLGFRKDGIVVIHRVFRAEKAFTDRVETIKQVFLQHPNVMSVAPVMIPPGSHGINPTSVTREGDPLRYPLVRYSADHDFLNVFEIPLVAGRNFEEGRSEDEGFTFILNERGVEMLGFEARWMPSGDIDVGECGKSRYRDRGGRRFSYQGTTAPSRAAVPGEQSRRVLESGDACERSQSEGVL